MKMRKTPMRRCAGCMESKDKKELIRIVCNKEGELFVDSTGKAQGRGVYLCNNSSCFDLARKKRSLARSLRAELTGEQMDRIFEELRKNEKQDS